MAGCLLPITCMNASVIPKPANGAFASSEVDMSNPTPSTVSQGDDMTAFTDADMRFGRSQISCAIADRRALIAKIRYMLNPQSAWPRYQVRYLVPHLLKDARDANGRARKTMQYYGITSRSHVETYHV